MGEVPPVANPVASDKVITIFVPDENGIWTVKEPDVAPLPLKVMLRVVPKAYRSKVRAVLMFRRCKNARAPMSGRMARRRLENWRIGTRLGLRDDDHVPDH